MPSFDLMSVPQNLQPKNESLYLSLVATLRLYAGWLLGSYFTVFALEYYHRTGAISSTLPFIDELATSPTVLLFSFAVFLFLLLSSLCLALRGGWFLGTVFSLLGAFLIWIFSANI